MIERRLIIKSCGLVCLAFAIAAPARASQPPAAVPNDNTKIRYISFQPNNASDLVAFEVALPDGRIGWVGEPVLKDDRGFDPQWIALVEESAAGDGSDQMRDWSVYTQPDTGDNIIHVTGCVIIPNESYPIRSRDSQGLFSATATFPTTPNTESGQWSDTVGSFNIEYSGWGPPNGSIAFADFTSIGQGFQRAETAPVIWLDIAGAAPDYRINYSDISAGVSGFAALAYFDSQPCCNSIADCPLGEVPPPPGFAGGTIAFVPVGATGGASTIIGNEIFVAGGVVVTVELRVSNWDADLDGSPRLEAFQATIDSLSFLGSNATPPNPGADLVPVGWPNEPHLGAYQTTHYCHMGTLDGEPCGPLGNNSPHITQQECVNAGGLFCVPSTDLVDGFSYGLVAKYSLDIEWGITADHDTRGSDSTSGIDDGASRHLGELRVTVPVGAAGTYTIGFDTAANATFMEAVGSVPITELTLTPAFITVGSNPAIDCQPNGVPDYMDIANGTSANCNLNGTPDECDIADGTSLDCNGNGAPDECDLADGTSNDCNGSGTPDECDVTDGTSLDCNGNGTPDECDLASGTSEDCNGNQVPDECDDCNANGTADVDDIAAATSTDCDGNCVPDECDPDCNDNGITDVCDIADGTSDDSNADNVPDECFSAVTAPAGTAGATKNRYLSIVPGNTLAVAAIAIDLPDGRQGWVGEPVLRDDRGMDAQMIALVVDAPVFRIWPEDVVHVTGCVVVPDQQYEFRAMLAPATFSDPLVVATTPAPAVSGSWADTVGFFDFETDTWGPPNGVTSFRDIAAAIHGFQQRGTAPAAWIDLSPQWPNYVINFSDVDAVLRGFSSIPYFESLAGFPSLADCPLGDQP